MKTKKLMLFLVGMISLLSIQSVQAETSAYQKKVQEIKEKYYSLFKYGVIKELSYDDSFVVSLMGTTAIDAYYIDMSIKATPSQQKKLDNYYANYKNDMKEAEKLLTAAEKAEIKRREFEQSPYGKLVIPVYDKIAKAAEKGEYEKTVDYEQRMKTQLVDSAIKWCKDLNKMTIHLRAEKVRYDPDKEEITLQIQRGTKNGWGDFAEAITVPLSIEAAKNIESFTNQDYDDYYKYGLSCVLKLNGYEIYPDRVSFKLEGEKYTVNAPSNIKLEDLIIDLSKAENAGKYLAGYKYNLTTKELIIPQTAKDELAAKTDELNKKIEEKIAQFNAHILADPYNIDRDSIRDEKKEKLKLMVDDYYTVSSIEKDYLSLMNELDEGEKKWRKEICDNLQKENPDKYVEITYSLNSGLKERVALSFRNYSCLYTEADYVKNLLNNVKMSGDCRNRYYWENKDLFESRSQYDSIFDASPNFEEEIAKRKDGKKLYEANKHLFSSKTEFDSMLKSSPDIVKEIEQRKADKMFSENKELFNDRTDFDSVYNSSNFSTELVNRKELLKKFNVYTCMIYYEKNTAKGLITGYGSAGTYDFQGVNSLPQENIDVSIRSFMNHLSEMRSSIYSERAIKYLIEKNKILSKEYPKVEKYFNGYWDFWDHYSSSDYKQYIKNLKKKK